MEKEQKESVDESALNDAFETRIARGETIEPKDWMPERYHPAHPDDVAACSFRDRRHAARR